MTDVLDTTDGDSVREAVRERYASAATAVTSRGVAAESVLPTTAAGTSCCEGAASCTDSCCSPAAPADVSRDLYSIDEVSALPPDAVLASLGCGNPTALAELKPGEVVLDLGSGGGIDVLLSARRVGPTGFAYGVDMTDEMLELAERNAAQAEATNVKFVKGTIESVPLPGESVDVVISNCVINLSADKGSVLREAFRVLRPGGRFAVSDVVVQGQLPEEIRRRTELWVGCLAGALEDDVYRGLLESAGFEDVTLQVTRDYTAEDAGQVAGAEGELALGAVHDGGGRVVSAFIRARKPPAQ
ncbi:MAG: arsenite methyltransferase [Candidatus Dormibacteria bacterium]|jgi:ubiquinone/menaquinone biosynthesis C-methylase UbiE